MQPGALRQPGILRAAVLSCSLFTAMSLYHLIYQSQSLVPFEESELAALLDQARANNKRHGITGMLLYTSDGRFLQVLEGTRDAVRQLYYQHIAADPRHYNCRVYDEGPCPHRCFAGWNLGFREAQAYELRTLLGCVPPDTPALLIPRPRTRLELTELLAALVTSSEAAPLLPAQPR